MSSDPPKKGEGPPEYALIQVIVTIAVIVILALLGPAIKNIFMGNFIK